MTTQMTRISNVGITKFVTLAQTTQVFWKEGHLPSYIMYANFPIHNKQSFSVSFLSSPFTELTELLTSSIGKKHLHPDLPLQLRSMVVLNIMGTVGRRARAQQTRIIRKELTCKQHWTIVKQHWTTFNQHWTIGKQHWTIVKQHWTIVKAQGLPTCVFYRSGNQMDSLLHRAVPNSVLQRKIKRYLL